MHLATSIKAPCWSRFSLRAVLAVMGLTCVGLSLFANRAAQQRDTVLEIKSVFGLCMYDYHETSIDRYDLGAASGTLGWMVEIAGIDYFHDVIWVDLDSEFVTDSTLERLGGLANLRCLHISNSRISNRGLSHLRPLQHIRRLTLNTPGIDDSGMAQLASLTSLERLDIIEADVTDAGLDNLVRLNRLRFLTLDGTKATKAGVEKLRKALPMCEIDLY